MKDRKKKMGKETEWPSNKQRGIPGPPVSDRVD